MSIKRALLALPIALFLAACGDDGPSGSSTVDWSDVSSVTWEKLSDGDGTWVLNQTSISFYRTASAPVFGVDAADSLNLTRYMSTNTLTIRFTEETEDKIVRRYCILNCVGANCGPDDADVWREVTGENPLTVLPGAQATYFLDNKTFTFEGAKIDAKWLYFEEGNFLSKTSGEAFWKR